MLRLRIAVVAVACACVALSASALDPGALKRARTKVIKGEKQLQLGNLHKAEELFRKAMAVEPAFPGAHLGLGAALVGQQRFEEALEVLAVAEEKYVDFEKIARQAGLEATLMVQGRDQEVQHLKDSYDVIQRAPSNLGLENDLVERWGSEEVQVVPAQLYYLDGLALIRSGRRADGVARLEQCLALDGGYGLAHYNLAVALFASGRVSDARLHLDAARAAGVEPHPAFVAEVEQTSEDRRVAAQQ